MNEQEPDFNRMTIRINLYGFWFAIIFPLIFLLINHFLFVQLFAQDTKMQIVGFKDYFFWIYLVAAIILIILIPWIKTKYLFKSMNLKVKNFAENCERRITGRGRTVYFCAFIIATMGLSMYMKNQSIPLYLLFQLLAIFAFFRIKFNAAYLLSVYEHQKQLLPK